MEMIERYIYAVTQKLPHSQREDIAIEQRGLIEDMLVERSNGKNATDQEVEDVLLELGDPRHLAQKYRGTKKYLIGPELYDSYILVLKIALISLGSVILAGFVIQTVIDPVSILDHFVELIVSLVTGLPTAIGWTTFGFAMAEYFGGNQTKNMELGMDWHPSKLAPIPDEKRQIKRLEPIISITFYTLLIAVFAFSREYFGVWIFRDEFSGVIPLLNHETYSSYMLFIILILGFGILKESLKLVYGKWTYKLVFLMALVNVLSFVAVFIMINGPAFWNLNFLVELTEAGILTEGTEAFRVVNTIWKQSTLWIPIFLAIGLVWEVVEGIIKTKKR